MAEMFDFIGFNAEWEEQQEVAHVHVKWRLWRQVREQNTSLLKSIMELEKGEDVVFFPDIYEEGMPVPLPNWEEFDIRELWYGGGIYIINGEPSDKDGWQRIK